MSEEGGKKDEVMSNGDDEEKIINVDALKKRIAEIVESAKKQIEETIANVKEYFHKD